MIVSIKNFNNAVNDFSKNKKFKSFDGLLGTVSEYKCPNLKINYSEQTSSPSLYNHAINWKRIKVRLNLIGLRFYTALDALVKWLVAYEWWSWFRFLISPKLVRYRVSIIV